MQFLLVERYLQIWLPVESAMILIVIYSHRLAIMAAALKMTELVDMAIKTYVLGQAENVYC